MLSTAAPTESNESRSDTPAVEAQEHLADALPLVASETVIEDVLRQKKSPSPSAMCTQVKDEKTGSTHLSCENSQLGSATQYAPSYQSYQKPSYGGGKFLIEL